MKPRRLLSIGHSYVVSLNRRLVNEMARLGKDEWKVTAIAPKIMHGDLRSTKLEREVHDICHLEDVSAYFSRYIHVMTYGYKLKQILDADWNIVHCWEEPYIMAGWQVAAWVKARTPLVYRTAQSYAKQYPLPFNLMENYAMSRASGWICSGQTVETALKNRHGYNLPRRIIPLGVDINHFYPCADSKQKIRQLLGWQQEIPVVGYLGRLVEEKGLKFLMSVLDGSIVPWQALFVGTGKMELELRTWAKQYGDRVRICTNVTHNQVPQYLNAMDILCAPSQTATNWREQFGRMIVEAFACGIPVIASDSGEIPYVVQDTGIIIGEQDLQGWIDALANLLENSSLRRELSLSGLERSRVDFSWAIVALKHLEFFEELEQA
jgi:glycosyltransferase involved in cell wall biosynthesis